MSRNRLRNPELIHTDFLRSEMGAAATVDLIRKQNERDVFGNRSPVQTIAGRFSTGDAQRSILDALVDSGIAQDDTELGDIAETGGYGATPLFTPLTAAGTTAATTGSDGTDTAGVVVLVPNGAGIAAGSLVSIVFSVPMGVNDYAVLLTPRTSGARTLTAGGLGTTSHIVGSFDIVSTNAPVAGTSYQWSYIVVPFH